MKKLYLVEEQITFLKKKGLIKNDHDEKLMTDFCSRYNFYYFLNHQFMDFAIKYNLIGKWYFKNNFDVKEFLNYFEKTKKLTSLTLESLQEIEQFLKTQFLIFLSENYDDPFAILNIVLRDNIHLTKDAESIASVALKENSMSQLARLFNTMTFGNFEKILESLAPEKKEMFVQNLGYNNFTYFKQYLVVFNVTRNICAHDNILLIPFMIYSDSFKHHINILVTKYIKENEDFIHYQNRLKNFSFFYTEGKKEYFFSTIALCWLLLLNFWNHFEDIDSTTISEGRQMIEELYLFILRWGSND